MGLAEVIESWARVQPERVALRCAGTDTTWRRLWNRIERASARLVAHWRVEPGMRVAYLGLNRAEEAILLFALARCGAILVPLNTRLAPEEWATQLALAGAACVVFDSVFEAEGQALASRLGRPAYRADQLIADPCPERPRFAPWPGATPVLLVFTSGTTGAPKGVLHTQDGLLWNASASIAAHDLVSTDHVLSVLPLFHVGGLCIQTVPALVAGACVTLHPRFDAGAWLAEMAASRPTLSLMVPATLRAVIEHREFAATPLDSLRCLMAGSSTIAPGLIAAFHARGVPVGQVYGSTETGPVSIVLRAPDAMRKAGSAGWGALHSEIRLVDGEGRTVQRGSVGEIWVRGRNLAVGYWRESGYDGPNGLDGLHDNGFPDGWFHSGDLAVQDEEGCYQVVGRSKDMIISGGENIYPAELEGLLLGHPDILDAAVVGLPDARWGESPVAAVVLRPGAATDAAALLLTFEGRIARFKHPREVCFVAALPKNALGKVVKSQLRAELLGRLAGSGSLA